MTKERVASVANTLAECGKVLIQLSAELKALADEGFGTTSEASVQPVTKPAEVNAEPSVAGTSKVKKLTLEDVRKVAADKARQGFTDEVRMLIQKFGAQKLSDVPAEKYADFLKGLEEMHHAS